MKRAVPRAEVNRWDPSRVRHVTSSSENPAMIGGWQPLAEDIMAFLISRGMRPTPHRYAIVSHLADRGTLSLDATDIQIGEGGAGIGRSMVRRAIEILVREGVIESAGNGTSPVYRLRDIEHWGAG
jgi:hypothetical protein